MAHVGSPSLRVGAWAVALVALCAAVVHADTESLDDVFDKVSQKFQLNRDAFPRTLHSTRARRLQDPVTFVNKKQAAILRKAAVSFQGSFTKLSTWNDSNPCGLWAGIICNYGSGTVSVVNMGSSSLSGTISPEFAKLTSMVFLDVSYNNMTGSIPASLGNLPGLQFLDVSNNHLSGPIPTQLGRHDTIQVLNLNVNRFWGSVPSQLGNLKYAQRISLSENRLTGPAPTMSRNMRGLVAMNVSYNFLSGPLPKNLNYPGSGPYLGLNNNYLYGVVNSTDPYCSDENIQLNNNCLRVPANCSNPLVAPQKSAKECRAFCSLRWNAKAASFVPPCASCRRGKTCAPRINQAGAQYFSCPNDC